MKSRGFLLFLVFVLLSLGIQAQRYNIGIRAGLNYSKILGPEEAGMRESHAFNNGIHFGLTYAYKFTDRFGLKTELAYSAVGSKDSIVGDSYYIFGINNQNLVKEGYAERYYERTNSYINIPIHAYFKPFEKLELFGGLYMGILINPTAGGTLRFNDQSDELKYSFIQSLDYNYYTDRAVGDTRYRGQGSAAITTIIDEQFYLMPQVAGAYYQFITKDGGLYNWFDAGLSGGFQYYINKSFFAGLRADYGLMDITRRKMDIGFRELNGQQYNLRDDFDQNFSLQISLGFKF